MPPAPKPKAQAPLIALSPVATVAGMTERLLVAECPGPSASGYTPEKARESMQLMVLVLHNRLKNKPSQYMAKNAVTILDIIKAKGQFAGFDGPHLSGAVTSNIQAKLNIANNAKDSRQAKYLEYIQIAKDVAAAPAVADPSKGILAFWRTDGSGAPTATAHEYKTIMGNTFYY